MSEPEMIRVLKITRPGLGAYYERNLQTAIHELTEHHQEGEAGETVTFENVEMRRSKYEALPEFRGW